MSTRAAHSFMSESEDPGSVSEAIEEPAVIAKILAHLQRTAPDQYQPGLPLGARAPPVQTSLL